MFPINVFLSNNQEACANWLPNSKIVKNIKAADLVIFEGGQDINPSLYKKQKHKQTFFTEDRDKIDVENFNEALILQKPILGICRGAQLGCALSGGTLIQHQDSGSYAHGITVLSNVTNGNGNVLKLETNSIHHQAMNPFNLNPYDYKIIGWSEDIVSNRQGESETDIITVEKDCEIVYFYRTHALCIQGHPEMLYPNYIRLGQTHLKKTNFGQFVYYCQSLVKNLLDNNILPF